MLGQLVNQTSIAFSTFSVQEGIKQLEPLLVYIGGIVLYGIFIFKFYRFLSSKDIFHLNLQQYGKSSFAALRKFFRVLLYILEYLIIFPLFTFFWFLVMSVILIIISKNYTIDQVLVIAVSLVGAVRVTAYYNEDLSKDLAKMIPFALLGVFIVDATYFSFSASLNNLNGMVFKMKEIIYYLLFVILLEFLLRILTGMFVRKPKPEPKKE
ncbi:MAG: hypothetical protein KJ709_04945 [Nanoarchaeota archaeon]|nr:hypothetical protein [Nanoarchaeota archaeon]